MATAPTTPNDLTRQQLDELDALLQRMLTLPINPPDVSATPAPASTLSAFAPPHPPPLPPAPPTFPSTLPFPEVGLSLATQPVTESAAPVVNRRVDSPAPAPAPHRYPGPTANPTPTPVEIVRFDPEPEPEPTPVPVVRRAPVSTPPAYTPPLEFAKPAAIEERPTPVVVKARQTAPAAPTPPAPVVKTPVPTPAPVAPSEPVALPLVPLVMFNQGWNGALGLLGFPGRVLRSGFVKNLFGLAGLGLLAYTAAKVAQIHGWISLPIELPWPR